MIFVFSPGKIVKLCPSPYVHTQRLFYLVICNAAKAREVEAARMWQRSFRGASSSFTTRSTYRVTRPGPPPSRPSTIKVILEEEKAEAEQETLM